MTGKTMHYFSKKRDEGDRIDYWCFPPTHILRPGVCGVSFWDLVDLDESGFYTSAAARRFGHSFLGTPAQAPGRARRADTQVSLLLAVDARKGAVSHLMYSKGTTTDKFVVWFTLFLLPAIRGTGKRVITMDNLSGHNAHVIHHTAGLEGHLVIFRPIHSPDFGPVEWCFNYIDKFLQSHDNQITDVLLRPALRAAVSTITANDIKGYMAHAHFAVQGHLFRPYSGEQGGI